MSELTDASGTVVEKYEYDAWGKTTIRDGSGNALSESVVGNGYGFTGRQFDPETGLYYYRRRCYSPATGRFLQTDPIGYDDSLNLYLYCFNAPNNFFDPYGLASMRIRPLENDLVFDTTDGPFHHDHFFFDKPVEFEGEVVTDLGFFGDNQIRSDAASDEMKARYKTIDSDLDDDTLLQAINDVKGNWDKYGFGRKWRPWNWRNCQDFRRDVMRRYNELMKEKNKGCAK